MVRFSLVSGEHDEVHLQVIVLVINSVLRRSMHVELVRLVGEVLVAFLFSVESNQTLSIKLESTLDSAVSVRESSGVGLNRRVVLSLQVKSSMCVLSSLTCNVGAKSRLVSKSLKSDLVVAHLHDSISMFGQINGGLMLTSSALACPVLSIVVVSPVTTSSSSCDSSNGGNSKSLHDNLNIKY